MTSALILIAALHGATLAGAELELMPVVVQDVVLFLSDEVTAGGAGGGAGVQLVYQERYLAQLDVGALWLLGNALSVRLALGVQASGTWSPAAWLTLGTLWGDRMEFLSGDGRRPALPTWSVGLRAAGLRLASEHGFFSALEPGVGVDLRGGLWLELGLVQIAMRI